MVGLYSLLSLICLVWIRSYQFRRCLVIFRVVFSCRCLGGWVDSVFNIAHGFALIDSQGTMASDWIFVGLMTDPLTLIGKLTYGAYDSITIMAHLHTAALPWGYVPIWLLHREIPAPRKNGVHSILGGLL